MQGKKMTLKLMKSGVFLSAVAALLLVGSISVKPGATSGESWVVLGFQEAKADGNRRVARRTSRRTASRN